MPELHPYALCTFQQCLQDGQSILIRAVASKTGLIPTGQNYVLSLYLLAQQVLEHMCSYAEHVTAARCRCRRAADAGALDILLKHSLMDAAQQSADLHWRQQ